MRKLGAWIRIIRLQFYPMTFMAYCLGAVWAWRMDGVFHGPSFFWGYGVLFLMELATVIANECWDIETDRANRNFSAFTGGSRVLPEGLLSRREALAGLLSSLCLLAGAAGVLALRVQPGGWRSGAAVLAGVVLGLGYTVPPLRLVYRGLGEAMVGFTHSFYVILCGWLFQRGSLSGCGSLAAAGLPLFLAVTASICLAGIPDRTADSSVDKRTLAVLLGSRRAALLASALTALALAAGLAVPSSGFNSGSLSWLAWPAACHGGLVLALTGRFLASGDYDRPINPLMAASLSYILWFAAVPLAFAWP
ncbi:MAG: prenyltransferase [Elusimicrobia bacterium]|nr:prenyltransferase [Elusimicrobiota bacterium]